MSISIVRGTNKKPVSSNKISEILSGKPEYTGYLFIGYPILGTAEGRYPIDALWVSPTKGLVIFDLIEGSSADDYDSRQDDLANKIEARLKGHRELTDRRELRIEIHTISYSPAISNPSKHRINGYPLANSDTLIDELNDLQWKDKDDKVYELALSAIESISTIRKSRTKRIISKDDSRGAKLKRLEDSIATLDHLQSKAVIETVHGVQRIRGLAGSGKTIVLALKAAYLHAQHPDWKIAVTFNTRSLKGQFRRLINNFFLEQTGEEPDWSSLRILNAWGASGDIERSGIYYEFCKKHDIEYLDYQSAKYKFGKGREFSGACEEAISQVDKIKTLYDAILVDEAQDFPPSFLRLCYKLLDVNERLVYAYDELQNLSEDSLPSPEEIFGNNIDGTPKVSFSSEQENEPKQDIILKKCYRNSRPVLVTAHSVGFGIYRNPPKNEDNGLVQMFDHPNLWEEIGYEVKEGELTPGSLVTLFRTDESSPKFLEDHSPTDDLIKFIKFDNENSQNEWLIESIKNNLEHDELRHDDIVVINPDPLSTRNRVGPIRRKLLELEINSHLAGVDTNPDIFFRHDSESVTFTGIYRAKGNEAGMVYIINAQDCHSSSWNLARIRNRLFTAITRSKSWIRVLGIGDKMESLIEEYMKLKQNNFELKFRYPTEEQREHLKIVHRDMTKQERNTIKKQEKSLSKLINDLEAGSIHTEDLDDDLLEKLQEILSARKYKK